MLVRLFVLGIAYERETHGYEIVATAKLWGVERWASIGLGSIYHALRALERDGSLIRRETTREGNRPEKTVYAITETGRETFRTLLRSALRDAASPRASIDLALAFAANLPPEERESLIGQRLEDLGERRRQGESQLHYAQTDLAEIPWIAASLEHHIALLRTEEAWTESLLGRIGAFPPRDWAKMRLNT